jgi:signal transduction histidine kinase/ligand-binding sensor domain-containing protein
VTRGRIVVDPRYVGRMLEICLFLALACPFAAALHSDRTIAQFAHTAWGPKDGAPSVVKALAQSADGYLWLGCPDGLYRFDGVVFERYQPQSGGPLPAHVTSLLALPNGDLWIGFRSGRISLLRNGHATNYAAREGVQNAAVNSFAQDRQGAIWATTDLGLTRLQGNQWKDVGRDWNFPGQLARAIYLDRQGTLWVATEETLVFLPSGARRFQPTGIKVGHVTQITQAASGKLWMAETTRSVRPLPLSDKRLPADNTEIQVGSESILIDNDGALWIASFGDGLRRAPAPELLKGKIKEFSTAVESFTAKDGLSDDVSRTIFQDREGNIWIGTRNGLDRFRNTNLVPIPHSFNRWYVVLVAGDARDAWVESRGLLVRVHGGRAQNSKRFPGGQPTLFAYRDPVGAIWWFGLSAIYRYNAGSFTMLALPPSFPKPFLEGEIVATEDGSGTLWMSVQRQGLFYLNKQVWQRLETASEFAKLTPMAAFTDWMGRAWFGYLEGTIIIVEHGNIQKVIRPKDSPIGNVTAIGGRGRHTWVGGEVGLAFFDGNRLRRIIPADAETFDSVLGVEETSGGSLWLAEKRGVIEIPATEVQEALADSSYRVKYRLFDTFDGLPGRLAGQGSLLREAQGTDGVLWFAASDGIAWIDPAKISTNPLPPPVSIRSVRANGRQPYPLTNLVLPPRTTNLQIGYTALSLAVPEKVRFRYRLQGVDKDWQDAGTRREAFYTRLGPGKYHFRAIACNNDGVWNEEGAFLDFNIAPAWYQTTWFFTLCAVAFLALLWAVYQLRLHQLRRQFNIKLEERVGERVRIARELHDTLLQSFHGLMFQFQAARNLLPRRPESAMQAFDEAILATEQAIAEGRDAIRDLRPEPAAQHDLAGLLTAVGKELDDTHTANGHSPGLRVIVEGKPQRLSPTLQDEIYRIGREVIRNAFHHAVASRIEVEIRYDEHQLRLRIRDDGKGIDPKVLEAGGSPGHWGLAGIRERAKRIGSQFEFWSEAGAGTEVELRVPAGLAYEKQRDGHRFQLFHREGSNGGRS